MNLLIKCYLSIQRFSLKKLKNKHLILRNDLLSGKRHDVLILNACMFQITGNTPLMLAVKDNKTPLIDRLVDLGADVCARNNVSSNTCHLIY